MTKLIKALTNKVSQLELGQTSSNLVQPNIGFKNLNPPNRGLLPYRRPFNPQILWRERKSEEPFIQLPLRNDNVEIHDFEENEQKDENTKSH